MARNLTVKAYPYRLPETFRPPHVQTISLGGSATTALSIYGPAAEISVSGSSHLFGAIVGATIDARGARFHYDEALGYEEDIEFQPYVRVAWRELGRPAD